MPFSTPVVAEIRNSTVTTTMMTTATWLDFGDAEEVLQAAVELQAVEAQRGRGAEQRGDDRQRVDHPAERLLVRVLAEHRREGRADQRRRALAEGEVGQRAAHHGVQRPAVEAPVEVGVLQRDLGRVLALRLGQAVRRRRPVRDRLGGAVEQQAGAEPGGEHHRHPGERPELGPGVVRAEPDPAPGVHDQEDAQHQRAERDQDEHPAEVADDPRQRRRHHRAEALGCGQPPHHEERR